MRIPLTDEERARGSLTAEQVESAARQVSANGYIVIEGVYSRERMREVHAAYRRHFDSFMRETGDSVKNGHYRMDLPFETPFTDEDVVANPFVLPIVERLLGEDSICQYFASNTCMPGSEYQQIHSDLGPLYPESDMTVPTTAIVLNIALVDFREDNGATEIWPGGTHLTPENRVRSDYIQNTAGGMESVRVTAPTGSIVLRDLRMWHRGTPNNSTQPRPMIALVYFRQWFQAEPLVIPESTYTGMPERLQRLFRKAMIHR